MKIYIDIREDVLSAAREIAEKLGAELDGVLSNLALQGLLTQGMIGEKDGIPQLPAYPDGKPVTMEMVSRLLVELE